MQHQFYCKHFYMILMKLQRRPLYHCTIFRSLPETLDRPGSEKKECCRINLSGVFYVIHD